MLVPMPNRLARLIEHPDFLSIISKKGIDHVVSYVAFHREPEVAWSCVDLENPFFCTAGVQRRW